MKEHMTIQETLLQFKEMTTQLITCLIVHTSEKTSK